MTRCLEKIYRLMDVHPEIYCSVTLGQEPPRAATAAPPSSTCTATETTHLIPPNLLRPTTRCTRRLSRENPEKEFQLKPNLSTEWCVVDDDVDLKPIWNGQGMTTHRFRSLIVSLMSLAEAGDSRSVVKSFFSFCQQREVTKTLDGTTLGHSHKSVIK